jgi:hypothetical protein
VKSWQCVAFWHAHERNVSRSENSTCGNVWPLDVDRETTHIESIGRRAGNKSS